jgi:hypothetical protein
LDEALRSFAVVKAPLLRITLHAVAAEDRAPFHRAMTPTLRAARLNDRRFRASGLSVADADVLVPHVLAFARRPRSCYCATWRRSGPPRGRTSRSSRCCGRPRWDRRSRLCRKGS